MSLKKGLAWVVVFLWIGILFYLSSQTNVESNKLSIDVTEILVQHGVVNNDKAINIVTLNYFIRKNAHYIVYFILGFLLMNASRNKTVSFLSSLLYGISDEIHQMFIIGRECSVNDILHDTVGAMLGILVFIIIFQIKNKNLTQK